jgi:hypothetical protein
MQGNNTDNQSAYHTDYLWLVFAMPVVLIGGTVMLAGLNNIFRACVAVLDTQDTRTQSRALNLADNTLQRQQAAFAEGQTRLEDMDDVRRQIEQKNEELRAQIERDRAFLAAHGVTLPSPAHSDPLERRDAAPLPRQTVLQRNLVSLTNGQQQQLDSSDPNTVVKRNTAADRALHVQIDVSDQVEGILAEGDAINLMADAITAAARAQLKKPASFSGQRNA